VGQSGAVFRRPVVDGVRICANAYQIVGGLVALSGVVYMQVRKLRTPLTA
jgi:hypothetical protein